MRRANAPRPRAGVGRRPAGPPQGCARPRPPRTCPRPRAPPRWLVPRRFVSRRFAPARATNRPPASRRRPLPRSAGRSNRRSPLPHLVQTQLEGLHRREVAQLKESGSARQPLVDRHGVREAGMPGDVKERPERRKPDQLGLGQLDVVLGRLGSNRLPYQPATPALPTAPLTAPSPFQAEAATIRSSPTMAPTW